MIMQRVPIGNLMTFLGSVTRRIALALKQSVSDSNDCIARLVDPLNWLSRVEVAARRAAYN